MCVVRRNAVVERKRVTNKQPFPKEPTKRDVSSMALKIFFYKMHNMTENAVAGFNEVGVLSGSSHL